MRAARTARNTYTCNFCGGSFGRREIQIDHISPVVKITGWDGFDGFIERLFCGVSELQVLCKADHSVKSKAENALRREAKKASLDGKSSKEDQVPRTRARPKS